jgi:hypothetical protein
MDGFASSRESAHLLSAIRLTDGLAAAAGAIPSTVQAFALEIPRANRPVNTAKDVG